MELIIEKLRERQRVLDDYLNSKELTHIECLIGDIEAGESAKRDAELFLDIVPTGSWDGNRRKWGEKINQRR